jgi:hypothetical protein
MKPLVKKGEIKRGNKPTIEMEKGGEESLLTKINGELEKDGFLTFTNDTTDKEYLSLPLHLDEVAPKEITRYLHAYTQQRVYIRSWLSRVNVLLLEAEFDLDKQKVRVYSGLPSSIKSVSEKEIQLFNDEATLVILNNLKELKAKQVMLSDQIKNIEEIIFDVSRELSRRGIDVSTSNREENINNVRGRKL